MMYKKGYKRKAKWKQKALVALYLTFALAHVSEFFYALHHLEAEKHHKEEIRKEIEIPPHIPEESKLEFIRMGKIKGTRHLD